MLMFIIKDSGTKKLPEMMRWESGGYFEGDIILNDVDGTQSAAIVGNSYRWPKAQVPYVISSDFSNTLLIFVRTRKNSL